jgi:hypothetical protein
VSGCAGGESTPESTPTDSPTESPAPTDSPTESPTPTDSPTESPTPDPELSIPQGDVTVDGDLSEFADADPQLSYSEDFTVVQGEPTISSGDFWIRWNDEHIAFAAEVGDEEHINNQELSTISQQDSLQFAVGNTDGDAFDIVDIAYSVEQEETLLYRHEMGPERSNGSVDFPGMVTRNEEEQLTTYELTIPWSEVAASLESGPIGLDIGLNDAKMESDDLSQFAQWGGQSAIYYQSANYLLKPVSLEGR